MDPCRLLIYERSIVVFPQVICQQILLDSYVQCCCDWPELQSHCRAQHPIVHGETFHQSGIDQLWLRATRMPRNQQQPQLSWFLNLYNRKTLKLLIFWLLFISINFCVYEYITYLKKKIKLHTIIIVVWNLYIFFIFRHRIYFLN